MLSLDVRGEQEPFHGRRPGLQSRVWRELTRLVFRYMANPELPVKVRRQRTELLSRSVGVPVAVDGSRQYR